VFSFARNTCSEHVFELDVILADAAGPAMYGMSTPLVLTTVSTTRLAAADDEQPNSASTDSSCARFVAMVWALSAESSVSRNTSSHVTSPSSTVVVPSEMSVNGSVSVLYPSPERNPQIDCIP
jgi:hypothetical protein